MDGEDFVNFFGLLTKNELYYKQSTTEGPFVTDLKALTLNMNNEYLIFETSASKLSKSTIF